MNLPKNTRNPISFLELKNRTIQAYGKDPKDFYVRFTYTKELDKRKHEFIVTTCLLECDDYKVVTEAKQSALDAPLKWYGRRLAFARAWGEMRVNMSLVKIRT